jgi:nucleotide-binding universal stress UspA family protein
LLLVKAGIQHNAIIQTGHVADTIAALANKGFDMVVMGSKGSSGLADLLLGSVAQRVMATCDKPVLLVK